ncbi:MAG: Dam family site-specific DNA-(adenine-N6)-methyltransferase [Clostridiaceae bacterium]
MNEIINEPFLRWAGGKRWLARNLSKTLSTKSFNQYHEPFIGCGALYFMKFSGIPSFISDINDELIETYRMLRYDPKGIISEMEKLDNSEETYYRIRGEYFQDPIKRAARFIYLNQTSYNGIYRVNVKGEYNVPYGFRTKNFLEKEKLLRASAALKKSYICNGDFSCCYDSIEKGDLVYLDPPYTVSHNNNGFIKYNKHLFSLDDFQRLSKFIDYIRAKGAFYIMSNAAHPQVFEIFDKGDIVYRVQRSSLVGGKNAFRGSTEEYVFTNIADAILSEAVHYERI